MASSDRDDAAGSLGKTVRLRKTQEIAMQKLRESGVLNTDDANTVRAALDAYLDDLITRAFRRQELSEVVERVRRQQPEDDQDKAVVQM